MTKTIALIDKQPNKVNYKQYFNFEFDHFHMSSIPVQKLLKKDVDLDFDPSLYDFVILVGSEAAKEYAKVTSVTNVAGQLIKDKFICISNPAMLIFKPEGKPDFERAVAKIHGYLEGTIKNAQVYGDFKWIINSDEAYEYLIEIYESEAPYVSLDSETTSLYVRDGYVLGISLSFKLKAGRYIVTDILDDRHLELLQKILDKYTIVFHNLKFDFRYLEYHLGITFNRKNVHDTMVMHYNLDETDSHGLKYLAMKYTDYGNYDEELDQFKKDYCAKNNILSEDFNFSMIPLPVIGKYAAMDSGVTWELAGKFLPIVEANPKLRWVYYNLLLNGTLFLMDMEEVGIPISVERMTAAGRYLETEIDKAKEAVHSFPEVQQFEKNENKSFNPNSVQQLRTVLFDYAKLNSTGKKTKTGALSTDAEVLEELSEEHPLPKAILNVRRLGKILNTYVSKILPELDRDGRIRTNFNLIFTTSGRLSSSGKFNAQQIPRDDPIIKGCIQAPPGYKIVSQDLQTGEMYYAAVLSGDKNLQKVFSDKSGADFHSTIAHMVFNPPCTAKEVKKLYPAYRQSAKAISFGILYGSGPAKVVESVNKGLQEGDEQYTIDQAKDDISTYFTKFNKLKQWLNSRKEFIAANGYTYSFFGRKRRLVNVFSADKAVAGHEIRSGINAEIQSLCSDVNLLGAMDTAEEIKAKNLNAKIFMLVHDSIVAIVKDECIDEYCEILKRNTQKDRGCSIPGCPIGVDQDIGQDYSFGKFEEYYTVGALEDGRPILVKNEAK